MPQPLIINCPACGAAMTLDDAYLAQYGGQTTTCPTCQQPFTIPPPDSAGPGVISYANPFASAGMLYDDGVGLVMQKSAIGPDRCVKCNAAADGYRWSKALYWHHPAFLLLILFPGLLIYLIVALCIRQSGRISVALCPLHRAARRTRIWIAWGIFFLGLALLIGGPVMASNTHGDESDRYALIGVLGGILTLLASGIYAAITVPVLTPRKIDEHYVYLARAGRPFLDTLPKVR
jgi:hypothetical protein